MFGNVGDTEILIILWLICGIIAGFIGAKKGEGCLSFIVGLILGPLGIIAALASSGKRKSCPFCKERIHKDAIVCPRCQRDLSIP